MLERPVEFAAMPSGPVRVFIACSLDGFIAGPDGDLGWLPLPTAEEDFGYGAHMAGIGALLIGRATYDTIGEHGWDWPYGTMPVLVATSRPLEPLAPTVRAVSGSPEELVAAAREAAGEAGVYADGGALIRSLVDAGLVDELVVTVIPVILGAGAPLFAGVATRRQLALRSSATYTDGLVQLRYGLEPAEM
jgi:dihydrofolate reductase